MSKTIDLTGKRFGYLTVIRRAGEETESGKSKETAGLSEMVLF